VRRKNSRKGVDADERGLRRHGRKNNGNRVGKQKNEQWGNGNRKSRKDEQMQKKEE